MFVLFYYIIISSFMLVVLIHAILKLFKTLKHIQPHGKARDVLRLSYNKTVDLYELSYPFLSLSGISRSRYGAYVDLLSKVVNYIESHRIYASRDEDLTRLLELISEVTTAYVTDIKMTDSSLLPKLEEMSRIAQRQFKQYVKEGD